MCIYICACTKINLLIDVIMFTNVIQHQSHRNSRALSGHYFGYRNLIFVPFWRTLEFYNTDLIKPESVSNFAACKRQQFETIDNGFCLALVKPS